MAWLNKVKKPKPTKLVKVITRPKGLILKGESWDVFAWNDSKQATQIENAMAKAIRDGQPVPCILMNPGQDGKAKLSVIEERVTWVVTSNGFANDLAGVDEQDDSNEPDELF